MEKQDLSKIESHIQKIRTAHAALADTGELDNLWQIIHGHGWTTPAEAGFLIAALESIDSQTAQLAALRQSVFSAAGLVNTGLAAGA
ncbi:MAG: hypothetical protein WBG02_12455 [Candidatus Acidiferrum sp.]